MSERMTIEKLKPVIRHEAWKSIVLFESGTFIILENFQGGLDIRKLAQEVLQAEVAGAIVIDDLLPISAELGSDGCIVQLEGTNIFVCCDTGPLFDDLLMLLDARDRILSDAEACKVVESKNKMEGSVVRFYRVEDPWGEFSNFARYPIQIDGKTWPTSEHYFQAQKYRETENEETIRQAKNAWWAARLGRELGELPSDWDTRRIEVMHKAVAAKFTQYDELKTLLLSTESSVLIEHTRQDAFWADGGDGTGENWLGKILMMVREDSIHNTR